MRDLIEKIAEYSKLVMPSDESGNSHLIGKYEDATSALVLAQKKMAMISFKVADFDSAVEHKRAISQHKLYTMAIEGVISKYKRYSYHLSGI